MIMWKSNSAVEYNTNNVQNVNSNFDQIESGSENQIRKNFPETWIWLNDVTR